MHHLKQDWHYAARDYAALLLKAHATISMAAVGEPTQNGHAERLLRAIKEEEVYPSGYEDFRDCCANMERLF